MLELFLSQRIFVRRERNIEYGMFKRNKEKKL
jgi:hypothetical protein